MSAEPPARQPQPEPGQQQAYAQPLEQAPGAVASLVCGILGVTMVPLIGSILALIFGYQSKRATAREPRRFNDALGQAGRVLGWVGTGFGVVVMLLVIALIAFSLVPLMRGTIDGLPGPSDGPSPQELFTDEFPPPEELFTP